MDFLFLRVLFVSDERLYFSNKRWKLRDIVQLLGLLGMSIIRLKLGVIGIEGGSKIAG